ncbi:MAG: PspA/IM30 family protein [Candidatus Poribacteria bacterium]|nr:PspA/IM30 family protein [Candidatus Poribacteria bacterium]
MKRLKQISEQIKENIDQFIAAAENNKSPLEEIEKTIVDMKKRIAEAKELVATAIAEEQRLRQAYHEAAKTAQVWREKVDATLQEGQTKSVKDAQQHLQRAHDLERQIHAQEAVVSDLKTALYEFYQQFRDAAKRAETLSQRQKQAETRAEFYKLLAEFDLPDDNSTFQQAEQKLKETEAEAKMWEERNRRATSQTETPEADSDLDQALAALKSDILGSSQND